MNGFTAHFRQWAMQPFSEDMPVSHWFLLIGMILVFMVLWGIILRTFFGVLKATE